MTNEIENEFEAELEIVFRARSKVTRVDGRASKFDNRASKFDNRASKFDNRASKFDNRASKIKDGASKRKDRASKDRISFCFDEKREYSNLIFRSDAQPKMRRPVHLRFSENK